MRKQLPALGAFVVLLVAVLVHSVSVSASSVVRHPDIGHGADALLLDNVKTQTTYEWGGADWVEKSRIVKTYDEHDQLTEAEDQIWESNMWVKDTRTVTTYDLPHKPVTQTRQHWVLDHWDNDSVSTYTYDTFGTFLSRTDEVWDGEMFVPVRRLTYTYENDRVSSITYETWNGAEYVNNYRDSYTYDGFGSRLEKLTELWEDDAWRQAIRLTYSPDPLGNPEFILTEAWDPNQMIWTNASKNEIQYDESEHETVNAFSVWFQTNWALFTVDSTTYQDGKATVYLHTAVFPVYSQNRTLFTYDGDRLIEEIVQNLFPDFRASPASWQNFTRTTYEYVTGGTAVQISQEPAPVGWELSQNYPNPFNPTTTIRYSLKRESHVDVTIYNLLGERVTTLEDGVQEPGVYATSWDGTDASGHQVASGIYLYRLHTDAFNETRKMLLLK